MIFLLKKKEKIGEELFNKKITINFKERRIGDIEKNYSNANKIFLELGWSCKYS